MNHEGHEEHEGRETGLFFLFAIFVIFVVEISGGGKAMFPRIAAIIICFAVGTIALTAQAQATGSLRGTVVDSSGNTMPGVTITVSGPERRQVVTNAQGQFSFSTMPLGDYEVRATLVGFETTVRKVTVTEVTDAVRIRMDIKGDAGDVVFIGRNP